MSIKKESYAKVRRRKILYRVIAPANAFTKTEVLSIFNLWNRDVCVDVWSISKQKKRKG